MEEQALIAAAQQGNLGALDALIVLYERRIYSYILRMVNTREDAQDLTQDTFLKLYKNLHSFDATQKFSPWIYTIATRTVYDWLRKKRRMPELLVVDDEESGTLETIDPLDTYIQIETTMDITQALAEIKAEYRGVLLLYYQQELTYQEIAEALHIPINSVKTLIRRAKLALAKAYGINSNID